MKNLIEKIKEERIILLSLCLFFIVNVAFFWLKQGLLTIDTGREFYIPYQMLKGQVLYKDILNIYGPLSYQINAFAFMLLGQKISSLLIFGVINSFLIVFSIYFISREFLSKTISVLITILVMFSTIFTPDLFNANMPYSYAVVYGLSSFLLSVLFLIKQIRTPKPLFCYLSCFFAGICFSIKYEYLFYPLILAYALIFVSKLDLKNLFKCLGCFLIVPFISFGVLFLQGLTIADLYNTFLIVKKMSSCATLKYFYSNYSGVYFKMKPFAFYVEKFGFLIVIFSLLYAAIKYEGSVDNKIKQGFIKILYFTFTIVALLFLNVYAFGLFAVFAFLLLLLFIKPIYEEKPLFLLVLCAITAGIKTFFGLNLKLYGVFTFPLLLVAVVALLLFIFKKYSSDEAFIRNIEKTFAVLLICFVPLFALRDYAKLNVKTDLLTTPKGNIYNYYPSVETTKGLMDYLEANSTKNDKVVILPETPFVNFFIDRDSDNYYNSLIPLYFETFGEQNIINHFKKNRPEYIVFNNRDTSDYGQQFICKDYALAFCRFVAGDYKLVKTIGEDYRMLVYKRKDLK